MSRGTRTTIWGSVWNSTPAFQPLVFGKNVDHVERDMGHAGVRPVVLRSFSFPFGIQILEYFDVGVSGAKKSGARRRSLESDDAVNFIVLGRIFVPVI
jgi:hypothetical protein